MTGSCQFSFGGRSGDASWNYDGSSLVVTPTDGAPMAFAVKEFCGISGDDYSVKLCVPGVHGPAELVLSRLGHDGPTLAEALRRDWLQARTEVLRLTGSGEGWLFGGQVAGMEAGGKTGGGSVAPALTPEPFRACLFEDVMVVAREGRDLEPVFLSLIERLSFDEAAYAVHVSEWPGREIVFSKMAKQTDEFVDRLRRARDLLIRESEATLAASVPSLPGEARANLAGVWMPGRLLELSRMESLCAGFGQGFRGVWLAEALRHEEASYLLDKASPDSTWLACTRETGASSGSESGQGGQGAAARPLWLLAGKNGSWFLEPISLEDHATYCFKGGNEVPALVSRLLCAPQFSKEALYSPHEELTGYSADLAIAATHLVFLARLRERLAGRVVHQSVEAWKKQVDGLG